jgi:sugar phosphate isomerase/epimerase
MPFEGLPLSQALSEIARYGFGWADIVISHAQDWGHLKPDQVKDDLLECLEILARATQVSGVRYTAINLVTEYFSPSERGQFEAVCVLAGRIGIPVLTVQAFVKDTDAEYRRIADFLAIAAEHGVTVAAETNSLLTNPRKAVKLVAERPGLKLTVDPGHLFGAGVSPEKFAPLYPLAGHVHLWDTGGTNERPQVPFGEGLLAPALGGLVAGLKAAGYDGALAIEYVGRRSRADAHQFDPETTIVPLKKALEGYLADPV